MSFLACCWPDEMMKSEESSSIEGQLSPIVQLDDFVKLWGYEKFKENYDNYKSCMGRRFPKMEDIDVTVNWDGVRFKSDQPKNKWDEPKPAEEPDESTRLLKGRFDPNKEVKDYEPESFELTYANTTDKDATCTFSFEKSIKSTYEVEISQSIQTGHNIQIELSLPEPAGISAEYEFSKLIDNYKGSKNGGEVETRWSNEYPVTVKAHHVATARFESETQTYKRELKIPSHFQGSLVVLMKTRKKFGGKHLVKSFTTDVGQTFRSLLGRKEIAEELSGTLSVDDDLVVRYTSSIKVCANRAVDQKVIIRQEPCS